MLAKRGNERRGMLSSNGNHVHPILKAFVLAYLTSTIPRLPTAIKITFQKKLTAQQKWNVVRAVLVGSIGLNRFPTSCALIVAGSTVIPTMLREFLSRLQRQLPNRIVGSMLAFIIQKATLLCAFTSAWLAFDLLNRDESWGRKRAKSRATQEQLSSLINSPNRHHLPDPGSTMSYAGKTIDFTLFSVCRATEVLVITNWVKTRGERFHPELRVPKLAALAKQMADPGLFAASAAIIMWSWFYSPERLPKQYNQWISKVADIDHRLINALRLSRRGELVYGSTYTQDAALPSLCEELSLPKEWGNPAKVVPIPCELYHCGAGASCEVHAARRFFTTFQLALRLYLPLQLIGLFRRFSLSWQRSLSLLKDAVRSSSFLAAFVGLFYYAVCLARTRVGPRLFARTVITPQMWDSGLCVLAGCVACGWSILLEKAGRRQEIAFFVAPRALATLMPRVYDKKHQRREQIVFAASVAIVMNAAKRKNNHVRGVFGSILESGLG